VLIHESIFVERYYYERSSRRHAAAAAGADTGSAAALLLDGGCRVQHSDRRLHAKHAPYGGDEKGSIP